ncbi:hypothetical protein KJ966_19155 [bacterium]|nr:hypothetical protein [bacterium]
MNFSLIKTKDFPLFDSRCRFTDNSVLTIAIAIIKREPISKKIRGMNYLAFVYPFFI